MVRLKDLRIRKGISQQKLAEIMGVSQVCISQWESDISNPTAEKLQKLADILNCSVDILLGRNSSQYPYPNYTMKGR